MPGPWVCWFPRPALQGQLVHGAGARRFVTLRRMSAEWPLIGRDEEIARAESRLARGIGTVIVGTAGVGKTALARQVGARVRASGGRVEWIAGRAARSVFPFEAFAAMLDERPLPLGASAVAARLGLAATSGGPAQGSPAQGSPAQGSPAQGSMAQGGPARSGSSGTGTPRPVFVVDDAHLLDQASADVLLYLAAAGAVQVIASVLAGEPAPDSVPRLWMDGSCERLDLAALSPSDTHALMEAVLGGQLDQRSSATLIRAAGGNLLFLRELVEAAVKDRTLTESGGVWQLRGEPAATQSLRDLIEGHLAGLTAEQRSAAELVAAGEPLPAAVMGAIAEEQTIDELAESGLIRVTGDLGGPVITMAHPLYGTALRDRLTPLRSRRIRLELARAFEQWADPGEQADRGVPDAGDQPGALMSAARVRAALWRLEAGDPADPGGLLSAASAARTFSLATAERLARAAVAARGSIGAILLLAEILTHRGRSEEATALTAGLPPEGLRPEDREAIVYFQVMGRNVGLGDLAGGLAALGSAGDVAADSPRLQSLHALLLLLDGRLAESLRVGTALMADATAPPGARVAAATAVCPALLAAGQYQACVSAHESVSPMATAVRDSLPFGVGALTAAVSLAHLENGSFDRAGKLATAAHERAIAAGDAMTRVRCAQALGRIAMLRGQVRTAQRWFRETIAVLDEFDQVFLGWNVSFLARAAAAAGSAEDARSAVEQAAGAPRMGLFEAEGQLARAAVSAAEGKLTDAAESAGWAAELAAARGQWATALTAGHDAARWGGAAAAAALVQDAAARVDGPLAECYAEHTVALLRQDPGRLAEVSSRFEALGALLHAGEAAAAAARASLGVGRRRQAAGFAARASALLARCEAPSVPWLAGAGSSSPLTGREQEVAVQAAAGHSDAQIAGRLGISARTVQTHLARAYAKLGIHDRRDLPHALSMDGLPAQGKR